MRCLNRSKTYNKASKAEVADLHVEICVYEHIVTLDIAMHDSKVVHVEVHTSAIQGNLHSEPHR